MSKKYKRNFKALLESNGGPAREKTLRVVLSVASSLLVVGLLLQANDLSGGLVRFLFYASSSYILAGMFSRSRIVMPLVSALFGFSWVLVDSLNSAGIILIGINAVLMGFSYWLWGRLLGKSTKDTLSRPVRDVPARSQGALIDQSGLPQKGIGVFGKPGAGLGSSGFGEYQVKAGVMGEEKTCETLISNFRKSPNPVALVNSIEFAGSKTADVDHALISGNSVFLIDSKMYRKGTFEAISPETVLATWPDGTRKYKTIRMDDALQNYRQILPSVKFPKAYVMIHSDGMVKPREYNGVFFGDAGQVVKDIKQQIGNGSPSINQNAFNSINLRRKLS